ncbi:MAG TPA: galactokinase [Bacteroidales bacterium]|nr:galactokinase [Bacteroidales bacterium]
MEELKKEFNSQYGESTEKDRLFFSPGRVNLIGEHTDYNGGYVFPCALSYGTYLIARPNGKNSIRFATTNFDYNSEVSLDQISKKHGDEWINYPLGVINQLIKKGLEPTGLDLLYSGNIPNGAGLSSSASIELVTAIAFNNIFELGIGMQDLVKLSQNAENEFVGVNCGIMDQFAVGMGEKDHAIFLNCDTLDYELVPFRLKGLKLVISNTNKRRGLADSKYNERRAECDKAVEILSQKRSIRNLSELSYSEFIDMQDVITDKIIKKRAKHVISENQRVLDAIKELKNNNLAMFGELMNASHESLRYDYEVTGDELDAMVDEARKVEGVLGSRMTGAGFGGCTVTLIKEEAIDNFKEAVAKGYEKKTGLKPDFYVADIGDGTKEITDNE